MANSLSRCNYGNSLAGTKDEQSLDEMRHENCIITGMLIALTLILSLIKYLKQLQSVCACCDYEYAGEIININKKKL